MVIGPEEAALYATGGAVVGTFVAEIAKGVCKSIGNDCWIKVKGKSAKIFEGSDKELLNIIINDNNKPKIYAGKGNALKIKDGGKGISGYLQYSSDTFNSFIPNALKIETLEIESDHKLLKYDPRQSAIYLGGPVANEETLNLAGYKETFYLDKIKNKPVPLPIFQKKGRHPYRWGQLHGETAHGVYNGVKKTAVRFDEDGIAKPFAMYGIFDRKLNKEIFPECFHNGFLANEWLTIIKRVEHNTFKIIIGGLHGHSSVAFAEDLGNNLAQLSKKTHKMKEFQAIIPVYLSHEKNLGAQWNTNGTLDWEKSQIDKIS